MRRFTIAVLWLSVGWPCLGADLPSDAVYANFFTDTANLNLYLRYLGAMESAHRVTPPGRTGQYALKLTVRFSPALRSAALFWDISPISFNRVRFRVWNPNPQNLPIFLQVRLTDTDKRGYFLSFYRRDAKQAITARSPLPTSSPTAADGGWVCYEARLPEELALVIPKGEAKPSRVQLRERAFRHLAMSLEVDQNFPAFGKPLTLIVDGLELFSSPDWPD